MLAFYAARGPYPSFTVQPPRGSTDRHWWRLADVLEAAARSGDIMYFGRVDEYGPYRFTAKDQLLQRLGVAGAEHATISEALRGWLEQSISAE